MRRSFEPQRILAQHVGARGFQHRRLERVVLELFQRLQREIQRLGGVFGLRVRADRELSRHAAAHEAGTRRCTTVPT